MLTDPKKLADLDAALRLYPDEVLAFQSDYPDVYLKKWDEGTRQKRLTGVAANDCHHNQVFLVKVVDAETVLLGTNVDADDKMRKITACTRPGIKEMTKGRQPGDILARLDFEPYYRSFRNSSTDAHVGSAIILVHCPLHNPRRAPERWRRISGHAESARPTIRDTVPPSRAA